MGDIMLFSEMQEKDIINLTDGNKIGKLKDLDINIENGKIISVNIVTNSRLRSFFSGEDIVTIPWENIVQFGSEVIIVNYRIEK